MVPDAPAQMRAITVNSFGGPEVLTPGTLARPYTINSDVLVRVRAAGVNPIDAKTRAGRGMAPVIDRMPWVPGGEFAGVVAQAPYELARFQPGDEVFGMLLMPHYQGAYAEYVSVPLMSLAHKPASLDFTAAGGTPLAALTAWAAVVEVGRVESGQRILIHAGAGGVGHLAVQLAAIYGAEVTTTASARNHAWLRELGAAHVIDYTAERFEEVAGEQDVVVDLIGNVQAETATRSLGVLRDGGLIVNVPSFSWPSMHDEVAAAGRGLRATGVKLSPDGSILQTIAQFIDQGDLHVHVDRAFALEDAAAAHTLLEGGHVRGKLVLEV